jgi:hypothetical protein
MNAKGLEVPPDRCGRNTTFVPFSAEGADFAGGMLDDPLVLPHKALPMTFSHRLAQ